MPERALTLGQVVGNLAVAREAGNRAGVALRNGLKDTQVTGHNRKFIEDDEEKGLLNQNPDEYKAVAFNVPEQLAADAEVATKTLDWALTQDVANCTAKADVIIDGEALLTQVPISHLLHLKTYFSEYKSVILSSLPTLEPTKDWGTARNPVSKLWESRTEKVPVHVKQSKALLLHSGTDKHPPQAVPDPNPLPTHIGTREVTILSGAVSEQEKRQLLAKIDTLIAAVKDAIAVANRTPAQKQSEGGKLFRYLLG